MVFTELLGMAEAAVGERVVDGILDALRLSNDGAYSAVGNYPCSELMRIVGALSDHTGLPGAELQRLFGHHMLNRFFQTHPKFFAGKATILDLLQAIEGEVHVEVRKLYPDAELPSFETEWLWPDALRMTYRSTRPLSDFCHGLIEACSSHFDRPATVERVASIPADPTTATFIVRLIP